MGIYEKALEIKAQLDTLKTNLGLSADTPLTDVVNTASSGGGGGTPTTGDIYRVKTIAERDALTGVPQNAICVVTDKSVGALTEDTVFTKISFAISVTLPTALDDWLDASFGSDDGSIDFRCSLNSYGMNVMVWDMNTDESYDFMYETNDGITFELMGSVTEIELSSPVSCHYGWDDRFGLFMSTTVTTFDGIFVKERNLWNPAYVGSTATEQDIFAPKVALTNSGKITGGLDLNKWSKHNIYVQKEEPTDSDIDNQAVWIKPSSRITDTELEKLNTKKAKINFTTTDITNKAVLNYEGENVLKLKPRNVYMRGDYIHLEKLDKINMNGVEIAVSRGLGVIYNGKAYLVIADGLNLFLKMDLKTQTTEVLATPPMGSSDYVYGIATNGNYIFLTYGNSSSTVYTALYSMNGGTWSKRSLSSKSQYENSFDYPLIPIDDGTSCLMISYGNLGDYFLQFREVDFSNGSVLNSFQITDTDAGTSVSSVSTLFRCFVFKRSGEYISTFDDEFELDLYDLSKENMLNALNPFLRKLDRIGYTLYTYSLIHGDKLFAIDFTSVRSALYKRLEYKALITGNEDTEELRSLYIQDGKMYLVTTGNINKIYSLDLSKEIPLIPARSDIVFQTGNNKQVEINEGTFINFDNVILPTTSYMNNDDLGVEKVYTRVLNDDTYQYEWAVAIDNSI